MADIKLPASDVSLQSHNTGPTADNSESSDSDEIVDVEHVFEDGDDGDDSDSDCNTSDGDEDRAGGIAGDETVDREEGGWLGEFDFDEVPEADSEGGQGLPEPFEEAFDIVNSHSSDLVRDETKQDKKKTCNRKLKAFMPRIKQKADPPILITIGHKTKMKKKGKGRVKELRPFLMASFRRHHGPRTGYVKRLTLIDTGAKSSAITEEMARFLKLKTRGQKEVRLGNGQSVFRKTARITVTVSGPNVCPKKKKGKKKSREGLLDSTSTQEIVDKNQSIIALQVTIRKANHPLLGVDWLMLAQPQFQIRNKFHHRKRHRHRHEQNDQSEVKVDGTLQTSGLPSSRPTSKSKSTRPKKKRTK